MSSKKLSFALIAGLAVASIMLAAETNLAFAQHRAYGPGPAGPRYGSAVFTTPSAIHTGPAPYTRPLTSTFPVTAYWTHHAVCRPAHVRTANVRRTDKLSFVRRVDRRCYSVAMVFSAPSSAMPFSSMSAASRSRRIQSAPSARGANSGTAPITRSNFDSPRACVSE